MKEKILQALKTKFQGVHASLLGLVAEKLATKVTADDQIEGAITALEQSPISITDYANLLQSEGDRRANEAANTRENTLKGQFELVPKGQGSGGAGSGQGAGGGKEDENPPKWALDLINKVNGMENKNKQQGLSEKLQAALKEKKIPVQLAKGRTIEKEEDLPAIVQEIENDFTAIKQDAINSGVVAETPAGGLPAEGTSNTVKADIEKLADKF